MKLLAKPSRAPELPNLERAARLLEDLLSLWLHPEVTHEQREALVREVFRRITIDGGSSSALSLTRRASLSLLPY